MPNVLSRIATTAAAALLLLALHAITAPATAQQALVESTSLRQDNGLVRVTTGLDQSSPMAYHPGRVIVRFRNGTAFLPGSGRARALSQARNTHLVDNPRGLSVAEAVARYRRDPNVLFAEPDYVLRAISTPTDPLYATGQWDLPLISAPQAWDKQTDASSVVVAVIDTGIDYTHPDLIDNLYSDAADPSIHGYTCIGGSCVAGGQDDYGHGTHVAGTIGAATNNATGMAGINWKVKLLSIKFLNSGGSGSTSDAVLGFNKIQALKTAGVNIRVTNNSWGGGGYSQALKDAMAAIEVPNGSVPGTLNVCAAGNSGVNADFSPMYPGAYDNRGILSVLATDSKDAGAYFTNYGVASVDLAAPGVSTLSTVPIGSCSLCDASGYKLLSGTSMATPHVAGVAAALLARKPALSAYLARDALLQPSSYDPMIGINARAASTSSSGRVNFSKALDTTLTETSALNQFPTVTTSPDVYTTGGGFVTFSQTASDPDDPLASLRFQSGRGPVSSWTAWLFGWQANQIFPAATPFTAPLPARIAAMPYGMAVSDNRGGSAIRNNWAVVYPATSPAPGGAPSGSLSVPGTATVGTPVTIGFQAYDPEGQTVAWDLNASGMGGSSGVCCYTGSSASLTFNSAGVYRVTVQAIDRELNTSPTYSAVITVGTAAGVPPIAQAGIDVRDGAVPFTVNVDGSGSSDPDGTIANYFYDCGSGFATGTTATRGQCTFTNPGTYWVRVLVTDNAGFMGVSSQYVVAYPNPNSTAQLTVGKAGTGAGTVVSTSGNINCGTSCAGDFTTGSNVSLTASPDANSTFSGWSGACSGLTCALTMDSAKAVTATFAARPPATYSLSVSKTGSGTITGRPGTINCGTACSASFTAATVVTLTATPQKGKRISSWGDACAGVPASTRTCSVTMDANKSASVTFK